VGEKVYYLRDTSEGGDEEEPDSEKVPQKTLAVYDFKERKETVLGQVAAFRITFDNKKMLVKSGKDYALLDLPDKKIETK